MKNKGDVVIGVMVIDVFVVLVIDYKILFDNNQWQVICFVSNIIFMVMLDVNGKVVFDGLELMFIGTFVVNDSFMLKLVSDVIVNMDVLIIDEVKIVMVSEEDVGDSDNCNGQVLLDL